MRQAKIIYNNQVLAGILTEIQPNQEYIFEYDVHYGGPPVSLTMSKEQQLHKFEHFPPYFEGVLPEGFQLEALLRLEKLNRDDYFGQLICVGKDLVGAFSVEGMDV